VYQHGARDSGGFNQPFETAQRKTPKGGQKEHAHREEHADQAGRVKNFQVSAMLQTTPLICERKAT
jgi:hypothetical protein